jgi:Zn finger protein HypA/HybF involved in hydrogenase expression
MRAIGQTHPNCHSADESVAGGRETKIIKINLLKAFYSSLKNNSELQ